jgi:uncharacterized protein (TIGR02145 family)
MNKNQFFNKHKFQQIPQQELDRKWRVFNEQEMFNNMSAPATAFGGGGISDTEPPVPSCIDGWMTTNLDVIAFRDGYPILQALDALEWTDANNSLIPVWCYYNFDSNTGPTYGKLYNYYVVEESLIRGIGPAGYAVPSEEDWTILENCLGGNEIAGGKLKTTGTSDDTGLWLPPNSGATDEVGFSGIPSGYMSDGGVAGNLKSRGSFWTTTEVSETIAMVMNLNYNSTAVYHGPDTKSKGYSIRLKTI